MTGAPSRSASSWVRSGEDLRLLASLIAGDGPLTMVDLEHGLRLGLTVAIEAVRHGVVGQTAARIFTDDPAARDEFQRVGFLEGYLSQHPAIAVGVRCTAVPFTAAEMIALCEKTRREIDGEPVAAAPTATAAPTASALPAPVTLQDLATRLGFVGGPPRGGIGALLQRCGLRTYLQDGVRRFNRTRIEECGDNDAASAALLERDLLAFIEQQEREAASTA